MIRLDRALAAWGTPAFNAELKAELATQGADLPLQQGLTSSSYALTDHVDARVLDATDAGAFIEARLGVFYAGVIAGCSCADDPTPVDEITEYCEVRLRIDRATGTATAELLGD